MTLEYDQFKKRAEDFVSISVLLGDEWVLKTTKKGTIESIYLEKRIIKKPVSETEKRINKVDNNDSVSLNTSFFIFVYHILYSFSYTVPILCFNAHHADGRLLTLEEIWAQIPDCYQSSDSNSKWNMITQQEHPILGIPCFILHPCHTKDLVPCDTSSNYIVSWLSIVGPVIGLNLSMEYAKFC